MAKSTMEHLKLGIFVVLGTILLLIAAYLIGNRQNMFGKTFAITAIFKNANGLQNGNNVRFSGIHVGTVNRVEMVNDTTIKVHMIIQEDMLQHIRKDAIATIGSDGLVGSMLINIVPGGGNAPLIMAGDELQSYSKLGTQDMLSTLNVTNENAALLTADLLKVTQSLNQGKGTLGLLLNDTTLANDLQETIINLRKTSIKTKVVMTQLNEIVEDINMDKSAAGVLLTDGVSADKLQNIIENLESSSIEINSVSKDLNVLIGQINEGKGTLGYLAKDTMLVFQLSRTMKNIEEGSASFNENMEALKHNFLTRRYFKKKAKQQKDQ